MGVALTEPSRECARVASTDYEGLYLVFRVHGAEEKGKICESLLRVEICEIIELPCVEWLRVSIETMLKYHESGIVGGAEHEWEKTGARHAASVLATNVNKDGAGTIPVLITNPVSLGVLSIIEVVEMINLVHKPLLLELAQINSWPLVLSCACKTSNCCRSEI